jgi:hypothetical protein
MTLHPCELERVGEVKRAVTGGIRDKNSIL